MLLKSCVVHENNQQGLSTMGRGQRKTPSGQLTELLPRLSQCYFVTNIHNFHGFNLAILNIPKKTQQFNSYKLFEICAHPGIGICLEQTYKQIMSV